MSLFQKKKYLAISIFIILAVLVLMYVGYRITPIAPVQRMEQAAISLSEAKKAQADIYSTKQFSQSQSLYDSAMLLWRAENDIFILKRNYAKVDSFITRSLTLSKLATNKALVNSKNIEVSVSAFMKVLGNRAKKFEKIIAELPLNNTTRQHFEMGRLLLSEATYNYDQKDYLGCKEKLTKAEKNLDKAISDIKVLLSTYFKSYSNWKKWYNETIAYSKNKRCTAIVIDKIAKKCYVYKSGSLKYTYTIELGKNWIGHKRLQGDKTTPEGMYKVAKKLDSKKTKYHRALLIDYPNDDDKKRFASEKKNGTLPHSANIGGLVEIHGDGGKGVNWTDGCVALHNNDMEVIYKLADVNTTVTIVGSLVDLPGIIDF